VRLKQIKLSGFKSFVDPTVLDVPGQLIGVVGPNGCGKSNIMDAVRWVLGESRANELRGESMQDVIFSGSSDRKPAARASVELVFDNSMGRIGGSWGIYAEVAVKRVLTRDGQSIYSDQSANRQTPRCSRSIFGHRPGSEGLCHYRTRHYLADYRVEARGVAHLS